MTSIHIIRQKDICPGCGGDIYEARLKLANPADEGKTWKWVQGYECLCGRFIRDHSGNRHYVAHLQDPERNDNMRQIAEMIRGSDTVQEAMERMMREAENG